MPRWLILTIFQHPSPAIESRVNIRHSCNDIHIAKRFSAIRGRYMFAAECLGRSYEGSYCSGAASFCGHQALFAQHCHISNERRVHRHRPTQTLRLIAVKLKSIITSDQSNRVTQISSICPRQRATRNKQTCLTNQRESSL